MGTVCTSQKNQQQNQIHRTLATENQITEHNNNYQIIAPNEIEPIEELKQSKIDGAQNSIDLLKKRQPSREMSQMSRALDEQRSSQNRVERFTMDIRDHQASQSREKRQSIMKDRSKSLYEDNYEENTQVNTIHKNKCKAKLQMNATSIILFSLNQKNDFLRSHKKILHKIVNDQCHIHENQQLINLAVLASSEAFLKNIQITDKHINFYGVFHILSQSLKQIGLHILLQNENQQLSNITLSNRLQLQLINLPQILALNQQKIYSIHINQNYDDLQQNYQFLRDFIRNLTKKIQDILVQNGIKNQEIIVLNLFRQVKGISIQIILPNLTPILFGFVHDVLDKNLKNKHMIKIEPLIRYVSVQQSDFNVWKSREIRLESSFDTVIQQQGWKLFALNTQLQDYFSYGYINMSKHLDYSNLINVFELNDVPKFNGDNDLIELKIFGEKKSFKMIYQIDYDPQNVIVKQDTIQANLGQSNLLGILIYDLDKRVLRQSMSVQQLLMDLHF